RDDAAWRLDGERVARDAPLVGQPAREDAHAVAALLRLAAVGIPDARARGGARRAGQRQDAVAADAAMPVAQAHDGVGVEAEGQGARIDDDVVVAERMSLDEAIWHPTPRCRSRGYFSTRRCSGNGGTP